MKKVNLAFLLLILWSCISDCYCKGGRGGGAALGLLFHVLPWWAWIIIVVSIIAILIIYYCAKSSSTEDDHSDQVDHNDHNDHPPSTSIPIDSLYNQDTSEPLPSLNQDTCKPPPSYNQACGPLPFYNQDTCEPLPSYNQDSLGVPLPTHNQASCVPLPSYNQDSLGVPLPTHNQASCVPLPSYNQDSLGVPLPTHSQASCVPLPSYSQASIGPLHSHNLSSCSSLPYPVHPTELYKGSQFYWGFYQHSWERQWIHNSTLIVLRVVPNSRSPGFVGFSDPTLVRRQPSMNTRSIVQSGKYRICFQICYSNRYLYVIFLCDIYW